MTRAYTNMDDTAQAMRQALHVILATLDPVDGTPEDEAIYSLASFVDVALRVMRKTNPSKIRDCAMTVEIKARMDGLPVIVRPAC